MTDTEKCERKSKILAAYNAGYIDAKECNKRIEVIEKEAYIEKYGEFDIETL